MSDFFRHLDWDLCEPGRKPSGEVGLRYLANLEFALLGNERDLADRYAITNQGVSAPNSQGWEFTGTDRFELPSDFGTAVQNEHMFVFVWWDDGSSWSSGHLFDNRSGTGNGIDIGNIGGLAYAVDPGTDKTIAISDSLIKAGKNALVCVRNIDETFAYINGILGGSQSIGTNPSNATATNKIGNQANDASPLGSTRRLESVFVWSAGATHALARSLSIDPYQTVNSRY